MSENSEFKYKDEICKIIKKIPLELINIICKEANIYGDINPSFKIRFIGGSILSVIILSILFYYGFFKKTTTILRSNKIIGIILTICIILSIYYSLMTVLEEGEYGMNGEKGFVGQNGPSGIRGKLGHTGNQGKIGDTGKMGDTGPLGPLGPRGEKGPRGIRGFRGNRGLKGIQGYKGIQGDPGVTGKPGVNGNSGPKGIKGEDNKILFGAAKGGSNMFGDSGISYPVYTFDSERQGTKWYDVNPFFHIRDDKEYRNKCDINNSVKYSNKTYNECKNLCTNKMDKDGYMKCVGIYGDIDPDKSDIKRGNCFICPERIHTSESVQQNMKLLESANPRSTEAWFNFVTGIHLKTVLDNDSAHAYLSKFYISSKE
jgi:hypothetical protein